MFLYMIIVTIYNYQLHVTDPVIMPVPLVVQNCLKVKCSTNKRYPNTRRKLRHAEENPSCRRLLSTG